MYFILGAAIGLGINALLNATGLHWLAWPMIGLLTLVGVVGRIWLGKRS